MTRIPPNPTASYKDVCLIAFDGMPLFEFAIAVEVFGLKRPEMGADWYRFWVASLDGETSGTTAGLGVTATGDLARADTAGTIIIPGWPQSRTVPSTLTDCLQRAHGRGARLVSICSGAFALAAAGLLTGRRATTHWRYAEALKSRHPDIEVLPDVLYVDEGSILTSAGSAAGIDLCLHIVRRDFGPEAANTVARRLVVPPHREGGQAQYVPRAVPRTHEGGRLGPLFDWLRQEWRANPTVADLARRAGMSERTFLRRFSEATGTTPSRWLMGLKLQAVRDRLETTDLSLDEIAEQTGLGTATNLRLHFRRLLNTTPSAYRMTFRQAAQ